jgi:trehalose synthase-fused probable maltokinase
MVTAFIPHQMDAWRQALGDLERYLEAAIGWDPEDAVVLPRVNPWTVEIPERARATIGAYLESAASIGRRTAELHLALAGPEVARACGTARLDVAALDARVRRLEASAAGMIAGIGGRALDHITASLVRLVAGRRDALLQVVSSLAERVPAGLQLIRIHGSLDLEQVLLSEGDFMFIDLEGDPAQSIEERRRLESPLIDVATMARSFHYAAGAGFIAHQARAPHEHARLRIWAEWWRTWTTASFLQAYRAAADGAAFVPGDLPGLQAWFRLALLERLFVEAQREAAHRPSYLWIPLEGILTEMGQVDGVDA